MHEPFERGQIEPRLKQAEAIRPVPFWGAEANLGGENKCLYKISKGT